MAGPHCEEPHGKGKKPIRTNRNQQQEQTEINNKNKTEW